MARTANEANIRRDEDGPDFAATIKLVRGQLRSNDSEQRSLAQDNGTLYGRIEKEHGVHKGAAKQFSNIDKMAPEKRTDFLRSLLGLLNHAGYNDFDDLVDRAQRPAAKAKAKSTPKKPAAGVPDALDDAVTTGQRTNLKTSMIEKYVGDGDTSDDQNWVDVREATPEELAEERDRQADFDDGAGNVHPFPATRQ